MREVPLFIIIWFSMVQWVLVARCSPRFRYPSIGAQKIKIV